MSGHSKHIRRQLRKALSENATALYPHFWDALCRLPLRERIKAAWGILTKRTAKRKEIRHG